MPWNLDLINQQFMQNLPNAGAAFQQGQDDAYRRQVIQQQVEQQQRAQAAAQTRAEQKNALIQEAIRNPSAAAFANLQTLFPEDREAFQSAWKTRTDEERLGERRQLSSISGYLRNGYPEKAISVLQRRADAERKAGNDASEYEDFIEAIKEDPKRAYGLSEYYLAQTDDSDKVTGSIATLGKEGREAELQPSAVREAGAKALSAEVEAQYAPQKIASELESAAVDRERKIAQTANEIAQLKLGWAQFGLDQDKLETETNLKLQEMQQKGAEVTGASLTELTKSVGSAQANNSLAERTANLAGQFETSQARGGVGSNWAEWLKRTTNNQDATSALRGEYQRLVNSSVLQNLPPGAASDRDIQIAREGFPPATANPQYVGQFLRGMAKAQRYAAQADQRKADWISANGNLGTAKRDLDVGGVRVPAGTTFGEFNGNAVKRGQQAAPQRNYLDKYGSR